MIVISFKNPILVALLCVLGLVLVTGASGAGSDIISNGHSWRCSSAVNINSVTVTIGASSNPSDGVFLAKGCTGTIGSITVDQWHGDGIKVGTGAHDLSVGSVTIHCYAHDAGKHQDGVQVMGGKNISFNGGYIGCYSANNSQSMIHTGSANQETPTNVIFNNITYDPAGVDDPTGQPLYSYGAGGAYGMSNGDSIDSGYENSTLISNSNHHPCFTGTGAVNPIWVNDTFPVGDNCP